MHDQVSLDVLDDGRGFEPDRSRSGALAAAAADGGCARAAGTAAGGQSNGGVNANGGGAHANGTGYGLSAMRRRLRQVGGNLEIESALGDGTTVSASVPALYRAG
jgi:signal transduction histidine kinase